MCANEPLCTVKNIHIILTELSIEQAARQYFFTWQFDRQFFNVLLNQQTILISTEISGNRFYAKLTFCLLLTS